MIRQRLYQSIFNAAMVVPAVTPSALVFSQPPTVRAPILKVATLEFDTVVSAPSAAATVTLATSTESVVRFNANVIYQSNFNVVQPPAAAVAAPVTVPATDGVTTRTRNVIYQSNFNVVQAPAVIAVTLATSTESIIQKNIKVIYQSSFLAPQQPPAVAATPSTWPWSASQDRFTVKYPVPLQRFGDFVSVTVTPPPVFAGSPEKFIARVSVSKHQFADLGQSAPTGTVTPSAWPWSQSPERFVKPYATTLQLFATGVSQIVPTATPSIWPWSYSPERFALRYPVSLQQFAGQSPNQTIPAATPSSWPWSWSPEQIKNPLRASLQQFVGLAPTQPPAAGATPTSLSFSFDEGVAGLRVSIIYDTSFFSAPTDATGGWASQWPERFARPYNAALQKFSLLDSQIPAAAPTPVTLATSLESAVKLNVRVPYQSVFYAPQPITAVVAPSSGPVFSVDEGIAGLRVTVLYDTSFFSAPTDATAGWASQWPERFKRPYNVSLQQFGGLPGAPAVATATPSAFPWSQSPERFTVLYKAVLQQYQAFAFPVSVTPQGWQFQQPDRFAKPYNVSLQQFAGFQQLAAAATPSNWPWSQSPDRFGKTYAVSLQQFAGLPQGQIAAATPSAWPWSQSPDRFAVPYKVTLQQFAALPPTQPPPPAITPSALPWSQSPEQFAKPYSVKLQQFTGLLLQQPPVLIPNISQLGLDGPTIINVNFLYQAQFPVPQPPQVLPPSITPFLPWQFAKPFPIVAQQFISWYGQRLVTITPSTWPWSQSPEQFAKPYPAKLQQFTVQVSFPLAPTPSIIGWDFQSPWRFTKKFPVNLQQFAALPPTQPPPPPIAPAKVDKTVGGTGYGSRTPEYYRLTGRVKITSTLTRKEMEFLLSQLPEIDRGPFRNEMDDDDIVFLLQNEDTPDDDGN